MKRFSNVVLRTVGIVLVFSAIGIMVNAASQKKLPWIYMPPKEIMVAGVKVPLIDEREARRFFHDGETVFVDTRKGGDYRKSHVKGSVFMSPYVMEELFLSLQDQLPPEGRLILYCYNPACDMAQQVAEFLAQRGYEKMMIMFAGYAAWEKAGYPVDKSGADGDPSPDESNEAGKTKRESD